MKVKVKSFDEIQKTLDSNSDAISYNGVSESFVKEMRAFCGITIECTEKSNGQFKEVYSGFNFIKEWLDFDVNNTQTIQQSVSTSCNHTNKFRNHAGGQYFWQCSVCKADLGDV